MGAMPCPAVPDPGTACVSTDKGQTDGRPEGQTGHGKLPGQLLSESLTRIKASKPISHVKKSSPTKAAQGRSSKRRVRNVPERGRRRAVGWFDKLREAD